MAGNEAKKPFWKKWWFWVIVVILVIAANGKGMTNTQNTPDTSASGQSTQTETGKAPSGTETGKDSSSETSGDGKNEEKDAVSPRDQFMSALQSAGFAIENKTEFDPQNRDSGYYRTEYRLGAYSGSTGLHGSVGDTTIDIIQYGGYGDASKNTTLRVYLSGQKDSVLKMLPAVAKSLDSNLSDADIQTAVNEYREHDWSNQLSAAGSAQRIENDGASFEDGDYVFLIDAKY